MPLTTRPVERPRRYYHLVPPRRAPDRQNVVAAQHQGLRATVHSPSRAAARGVEDAESMSMSGGKPEAAGLQASTNGAADSCDVVDREVAIPVHEERISVST